MRNLKYNFEYFCFPIWIEQDNENPIYENISLDTLPISNHLKNEIKELENIYQSKYNDDYPPDSYEFDLIEEIICINRVILSGKLLNEEIRNYYNLIFDFDYWNKRYNELLSKYAKTDKT
ncbi:hypothetical protein ACQKCJ_24505 [Flavobacterium sp. NPDC079362]|uniref:hypothetical protein n=1 Tax=Flavobacterium sp. NPDC079362 TaxID=3390566 RepID=UPI003D074278